MIEPKMLDYKKVQKYIDKFKKKYMRGDYTELIKERDERLKLFSEYLKKDYIEKMGEYEFGDMISKLWASQLWTNKDYLVQKIINNNGLDKLRHLFIELFYGSDSFEKRYERFIKNIKGLGPASITEILCYYNPKEFGIWNDKARKGLSMLLGGDNSFIANKYQISGREYMEFNDVLKYIAKEMEKSGIPEVDLLIVDFYLYEVEGEEKEDFRKGGTNTNFDHNELRDKIRDIGQWLGFDADAERVIGRGAKVDVIWQAKIANLGIVTYVFEVHKKGAIDSLILNLQKAISNPTVQKVIAVSNKEQIEKIKLEVAGLPENFRKSLAFWDVDEAIQVYDKLRAVVDSIRSLELIKSEF